MKTMQKGFTLIELMIVIAIIGILAAIAIPQYNDYVARSQASAGLAEVTGGRTAYEELFQRGRPITGPGDIGLQTTTTRCAISINYDSTQDAQGSSGSEDGAISCSLTGNPSVNGNYIELDRTSNGGWVCDTDLDAEFRPEGCS